MCPEELQDAGPGWKDETQPANAAILFAPHSAANCQSDVRSGFPRGKSAAAVGGPIRNGRLRPSPRATVSCCRSLLHEHVGQTHQAFSAKALPAVPCNPADQILDERTEAELILV